MSTAEFEPTTRLRFIGDCGPLFAAMAKAQQQFGEIVKDKTVKVRTKTGGEYTFDYAPLDNVLAATRPALNANGIWFSQPRAGNVLYTILAHSSGCRMESECDIPGSEDIKEEGGQITYLRRYSAQSVLGVVAEEDDDGNLGNGDQRDVTDRKPASDRPECPKCHKTISVIKGKSEYGGGWLCWEKKQGCGHKWNDEASPANEDEASAIFNKASAAINTCGVIADIDPIVAKAEATGKLSGQQIGQLRTFAKAKKAVLEPMPEPKKKRTPAQLVTDFVGKVPTTGMNLKKLLEYRAWLVSDEPSGASAQGLSADQIIECSSVLEPAIEKAEAYQEEPAGVV